jgi:hypothetical protein
VGKVAGQGCRARLPGKAAGQGCLARLPGKAFFEKRCPKFNKKLSSAISLKISKISLFFKKINNFFNFQFSILNTNSD